MSSGSFPFFVLYNLKFLWMKKSFLDYYKEILEKVSFDSNLLNKEYQKAIRCLKPSEVDQFNNWIYQKGFDSSLVRAQANQGQKPIRPFT